MLDKCLWLINPRVNLFFTNSPSTFCFLNHPFTNFQLCTLWLSSGVFFAFSNVEDWPENTLLYVTLSWIRLKETSFLIYYPKGNGRIQVYFIILLRYIVKIFKIIKIYNSCESLKFHNYQMKSCRWMTILTGEITLNFEGRQLCPHLQIFVYQKEKRNVLRIEFFFCCFFFFCDCALAFNYFHFLKI